MAGSGFIRITFEISGEEVINRRLASWGARIDSLEPAWEQAGTDLLKDFAANFDYEGDLFDRASDGWPVLAWSTVRDRIRRGYDGEHPILERTGQLRQSVTQRMAPGNVFQATRNQLVVGTYDPIAKYHQYGTSRMPPRPIVGVTRNRRAAIVKVLVDYVREEARRQGLQVKD